MIGHTLSDPGQERRVLTTEPRKLLTSQQAIGRRRI
jgi:hypothetical protein